MKIGRPLLASLITVLSIGCATGSSIGSGSPGDPGGGAMAGKEHVTSTQVGHFDCKANQGKHKMPQTIYVDATERAKVYFPAEIGLCKNKTDLVWVAFGASKFEITYKPTVAVPPPRPAKLAEGKAPCYEMLDANNQPIGMSCVLNKFSHQDHGSISYDIVIRTKDNEEFTIDPQLIIQK